MYTGPGAIKLKPLLISVLLLHQEYEEEKWDWDQEWAVLRFMAPGPSHKVYN